MPEESSWKGGDYSDNREDWKKELQRHRGIVHVNPQETVEMQKEQIPRFENLGNEHFSEGSMSEISVDQHKREPDCATAKSTVRGTKL